MAHGCASLRAVLEHHLAQLMTKSCEHGVDAGIPLRERLSVGALALGPSLAFLACQDVSPLLTLLALPIALGLNAAYDALLAYLVSLSTANQE